MKTVKGLITSVRMTGLFVIAALLLPVFFVHATAGVPEILNHQGRLLDSSGDLLGGTSGTNYCFRFSLYDDAAVGGGDTQLWPAGTPSTMTVNVKSGVYNVGIGDTDAGSDLLDYNFSDNDEVYLNIEVAEQIAGSCAGVSFENLSPRQRINASAYAITSGNVAGTRASAIGTTTPIANTSLTILPTLVTNVGARIRALAGQVADLFRVEDENGNVLVGIDGDGDVRASSTLQVTGSSRFYNNLNVDGLLTVSAGSGTSTFSSGLAASVLSLTNVAATSTIAGGLRVDGGVRISTLNCSGVNDLLQTDPSGNIVCGSDDTGAGGGISTIQVDDSDVVTTANTLDFLGSDFNVTAAPAAEGNIAIDYVNSGITRGTQNENIAGLWTFASGFISTASSTINGNATTTGTQGVGALFINNDFVSDLTGTGLTLSGGALSVNLGSFSTTDLSEGANLYYTSDRDIRFSTTSADYLQTTRNYFSTTSADYLQTVRNYFSTSSANAFVNASTTIANASGVTSGNLLQWNGTRWVSVSTTTLGILSPETYVNASTTIAHAGNASTGNLLQWNGTSWQAVATSTLKINTDNTVEGLTNLYYTAARDIQFSTTSADYLQTQRNYFSTTSANNFINASTTIAAAGNASFGNVMTWNGTKWVATATSTLRILSDNVIEGSTNLFYTAARDIQFSTTSSDYWKTQNNFFSTTSADYLQTVRNYFSTSSANAFVNASSTIAHAGNASIGNVMTWNGSAWVSTATSTLKVNTDDTVEGLTNLYYTTGRDIQFSTTSADYLQTQRNYFSTTSASNFINASSTIAHAGNASTGNLLQWNGTSWQAVATSTLKVNTDDTIEGLTNLFYTSNRDIRYSTTSADYWKAQNNFFATTSADYWKTASNFFSTTSADYLQTVRNYFSTTSADNYINSSTTIANASGVASGNLLQWNGTRWVSVATTTLGINGTADGSFSTTSADYYTNSSTTIAHAGNASLGNIMSWNGTSWVSSATSTLKIDLGDTTGTLPINRGGTNAISQTTNGLTYFDGTAITSGTGLTFVGGNLGIGTTSPYAKLSVVGEVVGAYFTGTTTRASSFPYASTTALSADTICLSGDCRGLWPTGSGGADGTWSTTTSQVPGTLNNYSNNANDVVVIGSNSTTTSEFWFDPNVGLAYFSGNVGIGTTSPYAKLSVAGSLAVTGGLYDNNATRGANGQILQSTGTGLQWVATSTLGFAASTDLANYLSLTNWYATTTDGLDEGLANLYYTSDRDIRYSTTSADYWKAQNNFFSTTSADYLQTVRNYFSTTSGNAFVNASSTIAHAGNASVGNVMTWNGTAWVSTATSTLKVNTDDTVEGLTNLYYTAGRDIQFSTTSADYLQTQRNYFSTTSGNAFVNASSTIAHAGNAITGNLLQWNGTSWQAVATSTLKVNTDDTIEGLTNLFYTSNRDIRFSTTSADYWQTVTNSFSTTSANAYINASTTIAAAGNAAFGNVMTWSGSKWVATATSTLKVLSDNVIEGSTNLFYTVARDIQFSTTSADYLQTQRNYFSTTSADYLQTVRNYFSTSSANAFVNASSTIAHAGNASTGNLLQWNGTSWQAVATSTLKINTDDTIEGLTNLYYTTGRDIQFSTTSADYLQTQRNYFSTTSASNFINASSTIAAAGNASFGNVMTWNGSRWTSTATSTLKVLSDNVIEGATNLFYTSDRDIRFSTTSSDYWKTANNFFATTSADYWASLANFFSTTSANAFINASTTIANASGVASGNVLQWNGARWISIATSTLGFGDVTGPSSATDNKVVRFDGATGKLIQTSGVTISDAGRVTVTDGLEFDGAGGPVISRVGASMQFGVNSGPILGGDGSTADTGLRLGSSGTVEWASGNPGAGDTGLERVGAGILRVTNGGSGGGALYANYFTATTTATSTFPTLSVTGLLYDSAGTGGANGTILQSTGTGVTWASTASLADGTFSTTSADYWKTQNSFFSTTSADYLQTVRNYFSTTSANTFVNSSTTIAAAGNAATGNVLSWNGTSWQALATSSLNIVGTADGSFSTTSADYWKNQNNFFATTSADYWKTVLNFFSTTSADYYVGASSTIAHAGNAALGNVLSWNGTSWQALATSSLNIIGAADGSFSTTSADYYVSASSTIAAAGNATIGQVLMWSGTRWIAAATSSSGTSEWTDGGFFDYDLEEVYVGTSTQVLDRPLFVVGTSTPIISVASTTGITTFGSSIVASTLIGSTAASGNLLFKSTSDATQGKFCFESTATDGTGVCLDEVNSSGTGSLTILSGNGGNVGNLRVGQTHTGDNANTYHLVDASSQRTNMVANWQFGWVASTNNAVDSSRDVGLAREAAGVLRVTNGEQGVGGLKLGYLVATSTTASSFVGSVGIGTTSPYAKLSVDGSLALTGGLYDNTASLGTNGMVLQTTGSGITWVSTSSLNIASAAAADGTFSTTSADYLQTVRNYFSTTSADYYINASTTIAHAGNATLGDVLLWNGTSWEALATSSLNIVGAVDGTFSTTSADYWKTQNNFFATTSADYLQTVRNYFSTSSANTFVNSSTTIAHAGNASTGNLLQWNGSAWIAIATSTLKVNTDDTIEGVTNLYYTAARDIQFSTTSADYLQTQRNYFSTTSANNFINASTTIAAVGNASFGNVMTWNGTKWVATATSTLKVLSDNVIEGATNLFYTSDRDLRFSTTSSDYWKAQNNFFSTTSADYLQTQRNYFSTTSGNAFINASTTIANVGNASFGNVMTWNGTNWVSSATSTLKVLTDNVVEGATNLFYTAARDIQFSTTSSDYWKTQNNFFSTTSATTFVNASSTIAHAGNAAIGNVMTWNGSAWVSTATSTLRILSDNVIEGATNLFYTSDRDLRFSTTSGDYWKTQNNFFSTTSADYLQTVRNYFSTTSATTFINASSTIAHAGNASTGNMMSWSGTAWTSTAGLVFTSTNLGVGTTSPYARLSIHALTGDSNLLSPLFIVASSTNTSTTTLFSIDRTGLTTFGDSSGTGDAVFQFAGDTNAWAVGYKSSDKSFNIASSTNLTGTAALSIAKNGNTTFTGSGGTCTINGAGSCTSDERLKEHIVEISGLEALEKLSLIKAVSYDWIDPALEQDKRVGLIAQDVMKAFPELVGSTTVKFQGVVGTYFTLDYAGLSAPLIAAVNELNNNLATVASTTASSTPSSQIFATAFFKNLFNHITTWLADTTNGITKFFAGEVHTDKLCVKKSDGTDVCLTGDQLSEIISNGGTAAAANVPNNNDNSDNDGGTTSTSTPPTDTGTSTDPIIDATSTDPVATSTDPEPDIEPTPDPTPSDDAGQDPPAEEPTTPPDEPVISE